MKAGGKQSCDVRFLAWLILRPWRWRWYVPQERRLTLNWPPGVVFQKIPCFYCTAVQVGLAVMFKACTREMVGPDVCRQTEYPEWGFLWFTSVFQRNSGIVPQAANASFHILTNSCHPTFRRCDTDRRHKINCLTKEKHCITFHIISLRKRMIVKRKQCRNRIILWHVDPMIGNDRETSAYTIAVAK
jgi:hypothetical protein